MNSKQLIKKSILIFNIALQWTINLLTFEFKFTVWTNLHFACKRKSRFNQQNAKPTNISFKKAQFFIRSKVYMSDVAIFYADNFSRFISLYCTFFFFFAKWKTVHFWNIYKLKNTFFLIEISFWEVFSNWFFVHTFCDRKKTVEKEGGVWKTDWSDGREESVWKTLSIWLRFFCIDRVFEQCTRKSECMYIQYIRLCRYFVHGKQNGGRHSMVEVQLVGWLSKPPSQRYFSSIFIFLISYK